MAENPYSAPESPLYGGATPPQGPEAEPQGIVDQLVGIFASPKEVFERLRRSPNFVPGLTLILLVPLVALFLWAQKVDMAAATERQMEVAGRLMGRPIPQSAIDDAISKLHGQPYVKTLVGHLLGAPFVMCIQALLVWAFALIGRREEDGEATFRQAFSVVTLQGLVIVPAMLLAAVVLAVKSFGGTSLMMMMPTHLAYFLEVESPFQRGLLTLVDPLYIWSYVLLYLGMKHTLRARPVGIVLLMALFGLFGIAGRVLGGMF